MGLPVRRCIYAQAPYPRPPIAPSSLAYGVASVCAMQCRGWVINGRYQLEMRRPLFPRKQTWIGPARAGKLGEFQRFSPGGLFGLSFNFLRMNQAHRSAGKAIQRFDHPPNHMETRLIVR